MDAAIKTILVPLSEAASAEAALSVAHVQAKAFNAHISTIVVGDDPNEAAALAGDALSSALIQDMIDAAEHEAHRNMLKIRFSFDKFIKEAGIKRTPPISSHAHPPEDAPSASLEFLSGETHDAVTWRARVSDVTLIPHLGTQDTVRTSEVLHAVLFDSGRPVIISPPQAPVTSGKRICIAWNGTAEAASALSSAMPWLHKADAVRILCSEEYHRRGPAAGSVVDYLALHGIEADATRFESLDRNLGAGLLAACTHFNADMLVMGAYSHSRLRQMILGGVTRHILEHAELTVFMSR